MLRYLAHKPEPGDLPDHVCVRRITFLAVEAVEAISGGLFRDL